MDEENNIPEQEENVPMRTEIEEDTPMLRSVMKGSGSDRTTIEQSLEILRDRVNLLEEKAGGLFRRFDPVLRAPEPSPASDVAEKEKYDSRSHIQQIVAGTISDVNRIHQMLDELYERCDL